MLRVGAPWRSSSEPCFTIAGATSCTGTDSGLAVSVSGDVVGNIVVECAVETAP